MKNAMLHNRKRKRWEISTYLRQKFSGLSWMVNHYYIQDYREYSGSVLTG